ncbi:Hypothetical_protein [Hexamita inflata]|uniref:Hypothetical_protein n=1 Tax=Hexamita inflata TaxID=28002 RepID=A0AA86PR77_9EUKA|nr:Hypothetical protein HINF_LOCUS31018 [Hexamita inflata]
MQSKNLNMSKNVTKFPSKLQAKQDNMNFLEIQSTKSYNWPSKITNNKVMNLSQVKMIDKDNMNKAAKILGNMWQEQHGTFEQNQKEVSIEHLRKAQKEQLSPPSYCNIIQQYPSMKMDEELFMELIEGLNLE